MHYPTTREMWVTNRATNDRLGRLVVSVGRRARVPAWVERRKQDCASYSHVVDRLLVAAPGRRQALRLLSGDMACSAPQVGIRDVNEESDDQAPGNWSRILSAFNLNVDMQKSSIGQIGFLLSLPPDYRRTSLMPTLFPVLANVGTAMRCFDDLGPPLQSPASMAVCVLPLAFEF